MECFCVHFLLQNGWQWCGVCPFTSPTAVDVSQISEPTTVVAQLFCGQHQLTVTLLDDYDATTETFLNTERDCSAPRYPLSLTLLMGVTPIDPSWSIASPNAPDPAWLGGLQHVRSEDHRVDYFDFLRQAEFLPSFQQPDSQKVTLEFNCNLRASGRPPTTLSFTALSSPP